MSALHRSPQHVLAIRHVHFEDLGSFEDVLASRGATVRYVDAGLDDPVEAAAEEPDLLVVLGGPIGAYEGDAYPWLDGLKSLLAARIAAGLPTLGICLGAQLMASALGARVFPGGKRELGWGDVTLTEHGMSSPLRHLAESDNCVLHWHGDTFDLPEGATLLASSTLYRHQAFSIGRHALGIQFHPEVCVRGFDRWLVGHAVEIGSTPGQTVAGLRQDTAKYGPALARAASNLLADWLDGLGAT